jgi:2-polyprenyl-3-methyl-5-hydroxy-6-metoxy-1,4-benzoquinol methylase
MLKNYMRQFSIQPRTSDYVLGYFCQFYVKITIKMKNCPYCNIPIHLYFRTGSKDHYRCLACDLICSDPQKTYNETVATYSEHYFEKFSADQLEGQRDRLYSHILELIARNTGNLEAGRLLDVGTGCGFFLVAAQKREWEVKGVEPSIQSVEVARRQNGLDVFAGTLQKYDENSYFDVITFINVLEHSTMPWREIARAKELLRPGGLIYLRFPNGFFHSQIYRLIQKYPLANWLRRFLVFHQYSFTTKYIRRLLHDYGFEQITIFNSPLSEGDPSNLFPNKILAAFLKKFIFSTAKSFEVMSCQRLLLSTSLEATARKTI